MAILSTQCRDMLNSLSWYMSARKTALRAALSFRTQLSVNDQVDMRIHYSGYFINMLAATELFREATAIQSNHFYENLCSRLTFDGFSDGKANYAYIRELRNAIVHRGLDITAAAHIVGDFPMILAPPNVSNQSRTKKYDTFGRYLLDVIMKCEAVIGPAMLETLDAIGVFEATPDIEATLAEYTETISQSDFMPEHIRSMALNVEIKPEWFLEMHQSSMEKLRTMLTPFEA